MGRAAGGRAAFLVARGDETVGVVIVCDAGDGVAQVELDYVTRRFRDFTPGEFVYRRSGLFRDRGFTQVVAPDGMVAPYYDSVGFRRDGDRQLRAIGPGRRLDRLGRGPALDVPRAEGGVVPCCRGGVHRHAVAEDRANAS